MDIPPLTPMTSSLLFILPSGATVPFRAQTQLPRQVGPRQCARNAPAIMLARRSSRAKRGQGQSPSQSSRGISDDCADIVASNTSQTTTSQATSPRPEITRDMRLREEISHPFRRPKLVIFGTLAVSAFVGSLFALGRLSLRADPLDVFLVNIAVNVPAGVLFAWLSKREVDFGRRSLGVLARCPQARDLPLERPPRSSSSTFVVPGTATSGGLLGCLLSSRDVIVIAGRSRDVVDVMVRANESLIAASTGASVTVIVCALDAGSLDVSRMGSGDGTTVVAARMSADRDGEETRVWTAWTDRVQRARKQVAVFRIPKGDRGLGLGDDYVVSVADASLVDLRDVLSIDSSEYQRTGSDQLLREEVNEV